MKNVSLIKYIKPALALLLLLLGGCSPITSTGSDTTETAVIIRSYEEEEQLLTFSRRSAIDQMHPEAVDYRGYEFRIMSGVGGGGISELFAAESNGMLLNDAINTRNEAVESEYNIKLREIKTIDVYESLNAAKLAGGDECDMLLINLYPDAGRLIGAGLLADAGELDPGYVSRVYYTGTGALSVGGYDFILIGDFTLKSYDSTSVIIVNDAAAQTIGRADRFGNDLESGEWTLDRMYSYAKTAVSQSGGGVRGISAGYDTAGFLCAGAGASIFGKNENEEPVADISESGFESVFRSVVSILSDTGVTRTDPSPPAYARGDLETADELPDGSALFWVSTLGEARRLWSENCAVSIMPMPKYSGGQADYFSSVNVSGASAAAIPVTAEGQARAMTITNALFAYSCMNSKESYRAALPDRVVYDRGAPVFILDLISGGMTTDLSEIFDWGEIPQFVTDNARTQNHADMLTELMERAAAAEKAISITLKRIGGK